MNNEQKYSHYSVAGLLGLLRKSTGQEKSEVKQEIQRREKEAGREYPRPY